MRVGFLSLALITVAFAAAPGGIASTTRIAFVQSQQPRNQTQPQEGQGLPPEKKRTLSGYGPEDVFGVPQEDPRNHATAKQPHNQRTTATPPSSPPLRQQSARSVPTPSAQPSAAPTQTPATEPSPTAAAGALDGGVQQPPLNHGSPSDKISPKWMAPTLIALALFVSAALIFTLTKLVEKIREGNAG